MSAEQTARSHPQSGHGATSLMDRRPERFRMEMSNSEIANNEARAPLCQSHAQGNIAFLSYRRFPDRLVIVHTEVPPALEGKGIAGKLVATALDFARAAHLRVIPLCSYAVGFLRKHPEYHDLLSAEDRLRILAAEPYAENGDTQRAEELRLMAFYEIACDETDPH